MSVQAAKAEDKEVQDMSDPLAVYTQAGLGFTDKGLNLKLGRAYDTGSDTTAGMSVIEAKGLFGDTLGWSGDNKTSNSLDSLRFRNFSTDLTKWRAKQQDINYSLKPSR